MKFSERIVARLRLEEDGSVSNKRVEQYALLRSEEVISMTAAWTICMSSAGGNLPSGAYQQNIHKSPAFKARLEDLMAEKAALEEDGVWGRLEWQARQLYRKACALDDLRGMQSATDTLLKIAQRNERASQPAANDSEKEERGRGAPAIEAPQLEDHVPNFRAARLLDK